MFVNIVLNENGYSFKSGGGAVSNFENAVRNSNPKDWFTVTNEYVVKDFVKRNGDDTCATSYGFVPDKIFDLKLEELGSPTAAWLDMYENRYPLLEQSIIEIIDAELAKRQEDRVEGIFSWTGAFAGVRYLGERYNCPVIIYVLSAIRARHGYTHYLYNAHFDESFGESNESRSEKFKDSPHHIIFSKRELLALLGKKRNFPLLKLLDSQPKYELGICQEVFKIDPPYFSVNHTTDNDLYYESDLHYPRGEIITRHHPYRRFTEGLALKNQRSDPASFILSCKRVAAVNSNILLKVLLWNRTAFMPKGLSIHHYLCERNITSENKVSNEALSHFVIGMLTPRSFLYSADYWRWRINEKPTETEIYNRHLKFYLEELDADMSILENLEEEDRFKYLLEKRGCDSDVMEQLLDGEKITEINFDVLTSRLVIGDEPDEIKSDMSRAASGEILKFMKCEVKGKIIDTVNRCEDGKVFTSHKITLGKNCNVLVFYPFLDLEARAKINSVVLDGENLQISTGGEFLHFHKFKGLEMKPDLPAGEHEISIEWEYKL